MRSFLNPLLDGAQGFTLRNGRTGAIVASELQTAFDSATRRTGLLKHAAFEPGSALIIAPSNSVHTFFMRFPIDLAYVDRDGRIVKTRDTVRPWRLSGALRAFAVIELPAGQLSRTATVRGDLLAVVRTSTFRST